MRIIGGSCGGRIIKVPKNNWKTRPTTDRAKEALFNRLENILDWEEISVLDLFGGMGGISLEAASRGAKKVTYVEKYPPIVKFVQHTCHQFNLNQVKCICTDVFRFIENCDEKFQFIFVDPPYRLATYNSLWSTLQASGLVDGVVVFEHDQFFDSSAFHDTRKYGDSYLSFMQK